jgi:uncharacterized repeat protein (TIGR03806 family)
MHIARTATLLMAGLVLGACDGGGSPQRPAPAEPFGLDARESRAELHLPGDTGLGGVAIERAFAGLGFTRPLFLGQVPGEQRLVVVEQGGRIVAFDKAADAAVMETILDLGDRVSAIGEQGLLGLAFDPAFAANRYLYVHYTLPQTTGQRRSVIARFTWPFGAAAVEPGSEQVILEVAQPNVNHNAGMLAFGPDGMLYIGLGDGGGSGDPGDHGQNLATLLGSLLRIDVHPGDDDLPYRVPPDNPFVGVDDARDEIWAYGLRNPWRFSFDRETGALWLADVGQNAVEEINLIQRGGNYGWRIWEGSRRFASSAHAAPEDSFVFPIHEYAHQNGASVTGGYVYRGASLPSMVGRYLFGDFVTGQVWSLRYDGAGVTDVDEIGHVASLSSFGEDDDGELYLLSHGNGTVHTLAEPDADTAPLTRLSDTGLFLDLGALEPAPGLIAYDVNVPQSADGAEMRRWIALPDGAEIEFAATGPWRFPAGTVLVQHFEIALLAGAEPDRRLETRLLVHQVDGWAGFTYRWDEDGADAVLLAGRETLPLSIATPDGTVEFTYEFPGRSDCQRCHTAATGTVLGVHTRQLNRDFEFPLAADNQLRTWNHIGIFDRDIGPVSALGALPAPDDPAEPVAPRARAWLDVNCAHCHRPDGPAQLDLDLRFATPLGEMNAVDAAPQSESFGIDAERIIARGDHQSSMLWQRIARTGGGRMPPLSNARMDPLGVELVAEWIDAM